MYANRGVRRKRHLSDQLGVFTRATTRSIGKRDMDNCRSGLTRKVNPADIDEGTQVLSILGKRQVSRTTHSYKKNRIGAVTAWRQL